MVGNGNGKLTVLGSQRMENRKRASGKRDNRLQEESEDRLGSRHPNVSFFPLTDFDVRDHGADELIIVPAYDLRIRIWIL